MSPFLFLVLLPTLLSLLTDVNARVCRCDCYFIHSFDLSSLLDLKSNVTNDPRLSLSDWSGSYSPCQGWTGVSCDIGGHVTCINLHNRSLSGYIPSSLGRLKYLRELDLSFNSFSGSIPSSLGGLTNLQDLDLSSNSLSGSIPPSLGGLLRLQNLWLSSNSLSGAIPSELGGLKNLLYLWLPNNSLSGSIPSSLGGLTNLQELVLSNNSLSGSIPSSLGGLANLQSLDLYVNFLSGSIPSSLGGMPNLQFLYLQGNSLTGPIPSSLGGLTNLQELYLCYNSLTGPIPSSLGGLTNLQILYLAYNPLAGPIPPSLGGLLNLQYLILQVNSLSGSIPPELGQLSNLHGLHLSFNSLSGPIPSSFGLLTSHASLHLNGNYLSGSLPFSCPGIPSNFSANCLQNSTCNTGTQRPAMECSQFYRPPPGSTPPPPPAVLTGLSNYISTSTRKQSSLFRHASSYFAYSVNNRFSWTVRLEFSWASEFNGTWPVRNQGQCGSCWAVATVSAVEAAVAITTALRSPPLLSVQQVVDCVPTGNCSGGWPADALEYISNSGLSSEAVYPYRAGPTSQSCRVNVTKSVAITQYESVKFLGWLGLMLAVQQQPVVVFLEASSPAFVNYTDGIFSSASCLVNGVDHSVLLVGYNIGVGTPHWIIRNSWGSAWGESGYMRLAIQGGAGVCGVNTFPGYYPVVKKVNDTCNTVNFGRKFLKEYTAGHAGTVNPCGRFPCSVNGTSNICDCDDPFVAAVNLDGSQTCVPKNACDFFTANPCGVGDCVSVAMGRYSCVCPVGYGVGQYALDNSTTCVPATLISGPQFFTVPPAAIVSCQVITQNYGLSLTQLVAQNKGLQCGNPIPAGTVLNVTNKYTGCSLPYATNSLDTCASIRALFNVSLLSGPGSPNPYLDCATLTPGQQVCIKAGPPQGIPVCDSLYSFALDAKGVPLENCSSIIKSKFKGNASLFFSLNPGLYCDRILNPAIQSRDRMPLDQVCLGAATAIGSISGCKGGPFVKVAAGQNCGFVLRKYFGGKQKSFAKVNSVPCANRYLHVGRVICI